MRFLFGLCLSVLLQVPVSGAAQDLLDTKIKQLRSQFETEGIAAKPLPHLFAKALVAAEDPDFLNAPKLTSPITAQLSRLLLDHLSPKGQRSATTMALSAAFTHDELLHWYAQKLYLGLNCYGVTAAAKAYFAKPAQELDLPEIALLAAIARAPYSHNPYRPSGADRAKERRILVLQTMAELGYITQIEAASAPLTTITVQPGPTICD